MSGEKRSPIPMNEQISAAYFASARKGQDLLGSEALIKNQLVLSFRAAQDIHQGQKLAELLKHTQDEPFLLFTVANGLRHIGQDTTPLIHHIEATAEQTDYITNKQHIYADLATWYGSQGDFKKAEQHMRQANRPRTFVHTETYLNLAKSAVSFKKDPSPFLKDARKVAGYYFVGGGGTTRIHYDANSEIRNLAAIAETVFSLGLDYTPLLRGIWTRALVQSKHFPFARAIEAFAVCGEFEKASALLDMIDSSDKSQMDKNYELESAQTLLVSELLRQGNFATAIAIALKTYNSLFIAETFSKKAVEEAKKGIDPTTSIAQADRYAKEYEEQSMEDERNKNAHLTKTLGYTALTQALLGKQQVAASLFALALHAADGTPLPPDARDSTHVLDLACIVSKSPLPADTFFKRALALVAMLQDGDSLDKAEFNINREDVIQAAIENGVLGFARETLLSITEPPFTGEKEIARLWIALGIAEANKGLSKKVREQFSPEDLEAILRGTNEEAKEAIKYFGLDKKI